MSDRRIVHIFSTSVFAVLLIALLLPYEHSGRIIAAVLLVPAAVLSVLFIKKRSILSINKRQVLIIMTATALVYLMLYYLSGLYLGFYKNTYRLNIENIFKFVLPIAAIITATEVIRYVFVAQKDKAANALCYLSCVIAEMLICSNIPGVTSFNRFMDLVAGALFPAIVSNLLYNYISKRYGILPNLIYRLLMTLYAYVIPIIPQLSESLVNFIRLLLPIAIYVFVDSLYEKKRRYALKTPSRFMRVMSKVLTVTVIVIMTGVVMVISNQFRYGALVIATESMTGELNKGDIAFYESYDDQLITEGQVIAYEKNDSMIVHRVNDIQIINGKTRYYTKGDANEFTDAGYITDGEIVGVVNWKLPYFGYPTLWMRSLFDR